MKSKLIYAFAAISFVLLLLLTVKPQFIDAATNSYEIMPGESAVVTSDHKKQLLRYT